MDDSAKFDISWNSQLEKVISDEGERCLCYAWLHDRSEKRYSQFSTCITLPSIVLATLSGSASIGSGALFNNPSVANGIIGAITLSVGLLTTISSYFSWAKRSEAHRIACISYKKLYRFILVELALPRSERMAAKDMLKIVRDEAQRMEETSPQIPDKIINDFKKKFGSTTPEVTKPEITNGLDPIYVYPSNVDSPFVSAKSVKINNEELVDPIYRSARPLIALPKDVNITTTSILKTSSVDHTPNMSQTSSSVHLPISSEVDNNHI